MPTLWVMDFWNTKNWFAVHTKPAQEEQAAMNIGRLGIDVFIPRRRDEKLVWGVPQPVLKPLFPRYLFARFSPAPHLHSIGYARGVRYVVRFGDLPLPVEERLIFEIQSRITTDGHVRLDSRKYEPGERVTVGKGPFQGMTGIFERELKNSDRVVLLLEAIEFQARVSIEKQFLQSAPRAV